MNFGIKAHIIKRFKLVNILLANLLRCNSFHLRLINYFKLGWLCICCYNFRINSKTHYTIYIIELYVWFIFLSLIRTNCSNCVFWKGRFLNQPLVHWFVEDLVLERRIVLYSQMSFFFLNCVYCWNIYLIIFISWLDKYIFLTFAFLNIWKIHYFNLLKFLFNMILLLHFYPWTLHGFYIQGFSCWKIGWLLMSWSCLFLLSHIPALKST